MRVTPSWLPALVVFILYNIIIYATWSAVDANYLDMVSRTVAFKSLVVPLGLDIAKADPTGTWSVTPEGPFEIGRRIGNMKLPTLLVQEGGYNIRSLGRNAARMLTGLCAGALGRRGKRAI